MSKLFIPVGLPGCGKSTFANTILSGIGYAVSTDAIRERITGSAEDQSQNDEVFSQYHVAISDYLYFACDVYADATNLRDFARADLRKIAEKFGDVTTHVLVFANTAQAVERNLKRERVVPPDVMVRFIAQFEQALRDIPNEGYDTVTYIGGFA